jgi:hypothetical protein
MLRVTILITFFMADLICLNPRVIMSIKKVQRKKQRSYNGLFAYTVGFRIFLPRMLLFYYRHTFSK